MADFRLQITMDDDSVEKIGSLGMHLFVFKAVAAAGGGGQPLIWIKTDVFGQTTNITWEKQFEAYTSTSEIKVDHQVVATNKYPIELGNTLVINTDQGLGEVKQGGHPGAITIQNTVSGTMFTCGISQKSDQEGFAPLCAFPIFYQFTDLFTPVEKVLVMFATDAHDTGTVIIRAFSPALLVDFTEPTTQATVPERDINYNILTGWDAGGAPWVTPVAQDDDLISLLIEPSATLNLAQVGAMATSVAALSPV